MKNKNNSIILILGLMVFLANGDNYAVAPLLGDISIDLGITVSRAALTVTSYMLTFGLFTLLFGPLSDRFGKATIINVAAFGTATFSLLGAVAYNFPSLMIFRAVNGAFGSGIFPVTLALVGELFDDDNRATALAKVMGLGFLGSAAATLIGGTLTFFGSWRLVYFVYGFFELVLAIVMLKSLKKDQGRVNKLEIIKSYSVAFRNKRLKIILFILTFVGMAVFGSFVFTGELIRRVTNLNILYVGMILSLFGIGTVIGGRIREVLKQKLKNFYFIFSGIIGSTALFTFAFSSNVYVLAVSLFFFGVSFILIQPTLISLAQMQLPSMKGTVMSLASFCVFVGGALASLINSSIVLHLNISLVFMIAGTFMFIAGVLSFILLVPHKEKLVDLTVSLSYEE